MELPALVNEGDLVFGAVEIEVLESRSVRVLAAAASDEGSVGFHVQLVERAGGEPDRVAFYSCGWPTRHLGTVLARAWSLPVRELEDLEPRMLCHGAMKTFGGEAWSVETIATTPVWFWMWLGLGDDDQRFCEGRLCLELGKGLLWIELDPDQRPSFLRAIGGRADEPD